MLEAIRATNGDVITVTDAETITALKKMAQMGFYIEPTSATAIAAVSHYQKEEDERVVVPLTGHGLKATEKLLKL
jgi:threonine synthase